LLFEHPQKILKNEKFLEKNQFFLEIYPIDFIEFIPKVRKNSPLFK